MEKIVRSSFLVLASKCACAIHHLFECREGLDTGECETTIGNKGRDGMHAKFGGFLFISEHHPFELFASERSAQARLVEIQFACELRQHVDVSDVFTTFKKCAKQGLVVSVELILRLC